VILPSPRGWISAKQSPPIPVDCGSITPKSAQAATAASAAVPPAFSTSIAASAASGCDVATMPFWAWTVERPARWKFLIRKRLTLVGFDAEAGLHDIFTQAPAMPGMPENRHHAAAAGERSRPIERHLSAC
jgi:hypothetical protein